MLLVVPFEGWHLRHLVPCVIRMPKGHESLQPVNTCCNFLMYTWDVLQLDVSSLVFKIPPVAFCADLIKSLMAPVKVLGALQSELQSRRSHAAYGNAAST